MVGTFFHLAPGCMRTTSSGKAILPGVRAALFLLAIGLAACSWAAPDEEILGKSQGYPLCASARVGPLDQHCLVGLLSRFDEVVPARRVAAAAPRALKRADAEPGIAYTHEGRSGSIDTFLQNNRNTGLLVMRGDTILVERYQYDRKPQHRFQSYSMAKTVVAMLVGIAIFEGKFPRSTTARRATLPD